MFPSARPSFGIVLAALALSVAGCDLPDTTVDDLNRSDFKVADEKPRKETRNRGRSDGTEKPDSPKRHQKSAPGPGGEGKGRGPGAFVTDVVDGDTIEVDRGERILDVRLIGVDTPETVHPFEPVECFGPQASDFTSDHLEGEAIRLEFDVERRDQYGRTLAYVWIGGELFNRLLVARGYATVSTYPPNTEHLSAFEVAESTARSHDRGLWDRCSNGSGGSGDDAPSGGGRAGSGGCDPNYSGACIPEYPPDLDCDDVSASGFQSTGSDPHGFDGDGDRVACE